MTLAVLSHIETYFSLSLITLTHWHKSEKYWVHVIHNFVRWSLSFPQSLCKDSLSHTQKKKKRKDSNNNWKTRHSPTHTSIPYLATKNKIKPRKKRTSLVRRHLKKQLLTLARTDVFQNFVLLLQQSRQRDLPRHFICNICRGPCCFC